MGDHTDEIMKMTSEERAIYQAKEDIKGLSTADAIIHYYRVDVDFPLPDAVARRHKRAKFIYNKMIEGEKSREIIVSAMKHFEMSERQMYLDMKLAREVFGSVEKMEKNIQRAMVDNKAKEILKKAINEDNLKEANSAIKNLIKLHNLDKENPELPDFSKLDPSLYTIILDQQGMEITDKMTDQGVIDLSKVAEDIPYEDIEDEEE